MSLCNRALGANPRTLMQSNVEAIADSAMKTKSAGKRKLVQISTFLVRNLLHRLS